MTEIADGWVVVWQNAINIRKNKEQNNYDQIISHVEATSNANIYKCATVHNRVTCKNNSAQIALSSARAVKGNTRILKRVSCDWRT